MLDFKDALDFPLYLRLFDVPGDAVSHVKDEESIFLNLEFAIVVLDGSKVIHKEHVIALNAYVIQRLRAYNEKVIKKESSDMRYKQYLFALMGETPEESGNYIHQDDERQMNLGGLNNIAGLNDLDEEEQDGHLAIPSDRDKNPLDGSQNLQSEILNMNSQHTIIVHNRHDTYKSDNNPSNEDVKEDIEEEDHKDDLSGINNIYKKKKATKIAMYPAIFHVITKKDMLSEAGLADQTSRAEALKGDIIDEYFFISSKDEEGIPELLQGIYDRRMDMLREEQGIRDYIRKSVSGNSKRK